MRLTKVSKTITAFFLSLLLTTPVWWSVSGNSPQNRANNPSIKLTSEASNTSKQSNITKGRSFPKIAPKAQSGDLIFDNGDNNNTTSLASTLVFNGGGSVRTADDFVLTSTISINCITTQKVNADAQGAGLEQVEIYADSGVGGPVNTNPLFTFPATANVLLGPFGVGTSIYEFTFNTPGLVLEPGKYWVSSVSTNVTQSFFASSDVNTGTPAGDEPGYIKGPTFGIPNWTLVQLVIGGNPLEFAFKIFGQEVNAATLEHTTVYAADTANNRVQRSLDDGMSWETVGFGPGIGLGQFNGPQGVSSDSTDTLIFVADTNNNRIQRSTNGGTSWQVIAGPGTVVGKVNAPQGVAYDEQNDILYIADTNNNRIQMATSASTTPVFGVFAGATVGTALGKVNRPAAVAVDINGGVYVADTANNRIQFNTTLTIGGWAVFAGATAGTAPGKVNQPRGIYVDTTGNVYVADTNNNRVQINMGAMTTGWSNFMTAGAIPGFVNGPQGVVLAASGNVFIGDTKNNRMQKKPLMGGTATVVGAPGTGTGNFNLPTNVR